MQLAEDLQTGCHVAVKVIPTNNRFDARTVASELLNQRQCAGHPNIVQLQVIARMRVAAKEWSCVAVIPRSQPALQHVSQLSS